MPQPISFHIVFWNGIMTTGVKFTWRPRRPLVSNGGSTRFTLLTIKTWLSCKDKWTFLSILKNRFKNILLSLKLVLPLSPLMPGWPGRPGWPGCPIGPLIPGRPLSPWGPVWPGGPGDPGRVWHLVQPPCWLPSINKGSSARMIDKKKT